MSNGIGERIRKLREGKKLTQQQLAKEMYVKRETVNQWENETRDLKTDYTVKLADYFNVTCDYILRGIKSENVDINRALGLSDKAIDQLIKLSSETVAIIKKEESKLSIGEKVEFELSYKYRDILNLMFEDHIIEFVVSDISDLIEGYAIDELTLEKNNLTNDNYADISHIFSISEHYSFNMWKLMDGFKDLINNTVSKYYREHKEELNRKLKFNIPVKIVKESKEEP